MSDFPNTDLETLRQSRVARLEAELHELASRLTHLHWPSTEAEITECHPARTRYWRSDYRHYQQPLQLVYIVSFSYSVNGKNYTGVLNSPVEVEAGDRFALRYNPDHPNENNSLCSENSPSSIYSTVITVALAVLVLFLFLKDRLLKH